MGSGDHFAEWKADTIGSRVYDLGRELSPDIPNHPGHPPLMFRLQKMHGDVVDSHGMSAANDILCMGTHIGTHIDGLAHIAVGGRLSGGVEAAGIQDRLRGFMGGFGMEQVPPLVLPGAVVDVARAQGKARLDDDHLITAEELEQALSHQGITPPPGGALLFRTGWGIEWPEAAGAPQSSPGPGEEAIRWALERGVGLFGSDTVVFERQPADGLPVHRLLLAEQGVHIIEMMDLEEICADGTWEFVLILAPLKLRGATGSPLRPLALALR